MKLSRNLGMVLLSIWLVANGLIALFGLTFAGIDTILAILAIAAGVVILVNLRGSKLSSKLGLLFLGLWLILEGSIPLLNLNFDGLDLLRALLALAAGVLILFRR